MSHFKKSFFFVVTVLVSCTCLICFSTQSSYAATNYNDPIVQKALLSGVYRCYTKDKISADAGSLSSFSDFKNLILSTSSNYVALPSGLTGINNNNVSCSELFSGYTMVADIGGRFDGVISLAGKTSRPSGDANKIAFLTGMGYTKVEESNDAGNSENTDRKCIKFTYNEKVIGVSGNPSEVETDTICATLDSSGKITELEIEPLGTYRFANVDIASPFFSIVDGKIRLSRAASTTGSHGYTVRTEYDTEKGVGDKWDGDDGLIADLRRTLSSRGDFRYTFSPQGQSITMEYSLPNGTTGGNYDPDAVSDANYAIQPATPSDPDFVGPGIPKMMVAGWKAIEYLSNGTYKNNTDLKFNDQEQISLLMASMRATYFNGVDVNEYWVCDVADWNDYGAFTQEGKIHISPDGTVNANCRLNLSKASDATSKKIYHFDSMGFFNSDGSASMFDLAETIAEINRLIGDLPDDTVQITPSNPGNQDITEVQPTCYNAASSLGWIVCPVLDALGSITSGVYGYIENNFLTIDAGMVTNPATRKAWGDFQGFANIGFVIFFTIVIFSQLTGIGLDNYSIKKVLPRLIMVAVLVNLSFIICSLAIDLSNILGEQVNQLFVGMAEGVVMDVGDLFVFHLGNIVQGIVSGMLTGTIVLGTATILFSTWEIWLFPFLIFLLGIVISLVFFFIILAVRQAAVVLLLVMAPLAIVCYTLPNTKKIFDIWKKGFVALLVVYPICGFIMGGGTFASTLLLAVGDESNIVYYLVAMLLNIVPIFFIPSILKSSMVALGNIGTKISSMGMRLGRGATGAIRNSDNYKELQNQMQGRNATRFMRRPEFRRNHKILGAPGRAMDAIGSKIRKSDTRIGRLATDMYNQKMMRMGNHMISAAGLNRKAANDAKSDYNKRLETARNAADRSYINELSKQFQDASANKTTSQLSALHADAIAKYNDDGSDESLAAVEAYQNMLATSDPGRQAMYDNYASAIKSGHGGNLAKAGQHLVNQHVGNIKSNNRDFWALANEVANSGSINTDSFKEYTDMDGKKHYHSNLFNSRGIDSYTSADLPKMDIGALDRLIEEATHGNLSADDKASLERMTREAIMSDTIHVQDKVAKRFNKLRTEMGYQPVTKTDSGSIPIDPDNKKKGKKNKNNKNNRRR